MTTSPRTFALRKPDGTERVPRSTLAYFQGRNKSRLYDVVVEQLEESGLTQSEIARRLGKGSDQVCRWLSAPGNWTLDTVSDLIFAITGGELEYSLSFPLDQPLRNHSKPEWADMPAFSVKDSPSIVQITNKSTIGSTQRFEFIGMSADKED